VNGGEFSIPLPDRRSSTTGFFGSWARQMSRSAALTMPAFGRFQLPEIAAATACGLIPLARAAQICWPSERLLKTLKG
jgi:hypothetical protein